jgi:hypothetical protein
VKCFAFSAFVALAAVGTAQEFPVVATPDVLPSTKMPSAPKIDGIVDAGEWTGAATSSRTLVDVGSNQPTNEKGTYWIGYDDKAVYIAVRIFLENPKRIVADEFRDNVSLQGNDAVTIYLDVMGTTRDINSIEFNANGALNLSVAGGRASKSEWRGLAQAAAHPTETGWEGEVRIPWDILPLPASGKRDIRYLVDWYVSSRQRGLSFHSTQGDLSKMHTLTGVEIPDVKSGKSLLLLPYGFVGVDDDGKHIANGGLDFKLPFGETMTFVGTVNPDFRNIENDILSLDFSNFERLADETRPFFLEGADFRRTGFENPLFASQRIRQFDAGFNVYGNIDESTQFNAIATFNPGTQDTGLVSATFTPDPSLLISTSVVSLQRPGLDNVGEHLDFVKWSGPMQYFGLVTHTNDEIRGDGFAYVGGAQYSKNGWRGTVVVSRSDENFEPRLGFAQLRNYSGVNANLSRQQVYRTGMLQRSQWLFSIDHFDQLGGGGTYYKGQTLFWNGGFRNGMAVNASWSGSRFFDTYDNLHELSVSYPAGNPYRGVAATYNTGNIAGHSYQSWSVSARYRPVKRLQLSIGWEDVHHYDHQSQLIGNFNYQINKYDAFGGRVVGRNSDWNAYVSYRHSGGNGAEYYIILGDPNANEFKKSLVLKYVMPIDIKF